MRAVGAVFIVVLAGCTFDFDGVGPGATGAGGSGAGAAGGPVGGKSQGGDAGNNSTGGGDIGGGNVGGSASCSVDNGECVLQPFGFNGIVELREGTSCAGPDVFSGGLAGAPFTAPVAACACSCVFTEGTCANVKAWSDTICGGGEGGAVLEVGCTPLPLAGGLPVFSIEIELGQVLGAFCVSNDLPSAPAAPVTFDEQVHACEIETSLDCEDGSVCLPNDGGTYCLVAEGATECPSGTFSNPKRVLQPTDFTDTRVCTCGCGTTNGLVSCTAPASIDLFESNNCSGSAQFETVTGPGCFAGEEAIGSVDITPDINGSCTLATPDTSGAATPILDAGFLLCCNTP